MVPDDVEFPKISVIFLHRAEIYHSRCMQQDRKNLDKYVKTIDEVNNLKNTVSESDKAELEEMKSPG